MQATRSRTRPGNTKKGAAARLPLFVFCGGDSAWQPVGLCPRIVHSQFANTEDRFFKSERLLGSTQYARSNLRRHYRTRILGQSSG